MEITEKDIIDNLHGEKALKNQEEINALISESEQLSRQLQEIFNKRIDQLKPVFDVILNRGLLFKYPDNNVKGGSTVGPIVDYDNNYFYSYSIQEHLIYKISNFSLKVEEKIHLYPFIKQCDFHKVMRGLDYVLELQDYYAGIFNKEINEKRDLIEKYGR